MTNPIDEWEAEPDHLDFGTHGYSCYIKRNHELKFLCGYVCLPPGHPAIELCGPEEEGPKGFDYDKLDVHVHGGVTFMRTHTFGDKEGVWVGFDCGHAFDYWPGMVEIMTKIGSQDNLKHFTENCTYRNIHYVQEECAELARQLKAMEKPKLLAAPIKE